jgi:SseB protein N-terminal domain
LTFARTHAVDEPINPPGELSPLTAALQEAGRAPTDAAKASIYRRLLDAVLLAPLAPASTDEKAILLVERKPDGRHELPVFSCRRAFRLWGAVPTHLAVRAPDLFRTALLQGVDRVALDPAGPVRATLGSWEVRRIAAGTVPEVHGSPDRDARSALGLPDPPLPDDFRQALCAALADLAKVTSAAVFEAEPVRGRRHLVVGMRLAADEPAEPLAERIHDRIAATAPDGAMLNYARLEDGEPFASLEPRATVYRS